MRALRKQIEVRVKKVLRERRRPPDVALVIQQERMFVEQERWVIDEGLRDTTHRACRPCVMPYMHNLILGRSRNGIPCQIVPKRCHDKLEDSATRCGTKVLRRRGHRLTRVASGTSLANIVDAVLVAEAFPATHVVTAIPDLAAMSRATGICSRERHTPTDSAEAAILATATCLRRILAASFSAQPARLAFPAVAVAGEGFTTIVSKFSGAALRSLCTSAADAGLRRFVAR